MSKCSHGGELVMIAAAIAMAIASDLSADDTNMLANLFSAIGDNLAIIADEKEKCDEQGQ